MQNLRQIKISDKTGSFQNKQLKWKPKQIGNLHVFQTRQACMSPPMPLKTASSKKNNRPKQMGNPISFQADKKKQQTKGTWQPPYHVKADKTKTNQNDNSYTIVKSDKNNSNH